MDSETPPVYEVDEGECSTSGDNGSGQSSEDELAKRLEKKVPRNLRKAALIFDDEASKETKELMMRCSDYVGLYVLRYKQGTITKEFHRRFTDLTDIYLPSGRFITFRNPWEHMVYPKFYNLLLFLKEVDKLESLLGRHMWDLYYISSEKNFGGNRDASSHFSYRVIAVIKKVFDAVMKRDWNSTALTISNIRLVCSPFALEKIYLEKSIKTFTFYFPSLYFVTLQRYLESKNSIIKTSQKYFTALNLFLCTCVLCSRYCNYSEFYLTQFLIFHLANLLLDSVDVKYNVTHQDPEWARVFQIYRYCVDYEKWLANRDSQVVANIPPNVSSYFSTILNALTTDARNPLSCVGLLPAFVHLAKVLNQQRELQDVLEDCCARNPALLAYVSNILDHFELHQITGHLFRRAIESVAAENLACYDFVIDIVEQQSVDPTSHGAFEDIISLNFRLLFNYLDYGRNRNDGRAWGLLYANMKYVEANAQEFVGPFWKERCSWWPVFHSVPLVKAARKARKNVFAFLESLE